MIEGNIKDLQIKFVGEMGWIKLRDFLVRKFQECQTEKDFEFVMKGVVGSMFRSVKELDKARKALFLEHLSEHDKKRLKGGSA